MFQQAEETGTILKQKNKYFLLYAFFWVIPRRLNFICRRFGTLCLFHLHRRIGMLVEQTERSETLAYKIRKPGNYPEERIQHSEHDESLKSRNISRMNTSFSLFHLETRVYAYFLLHQYK
jgi:hypothetical protein